MYAKIFCFVSCSLLLIACNNERGSGNIIKRERAIGNFSSLKVENGIEAVVTVGSPQTVFVEADDNIIERIITDVDNDVLEITMKPGSNFNRAVRKVYITTPTLDALSASSSANILVKGVVTNANGIELTSSSSSIIQASIQSPNVDAKVSSSGKVIISGKTKNFAVKSSSSGKIMAQNLLAEDTEVKASSSSTCMVHASIKLNATASSSASIKYKGNPQLIVQESSSGRVRPSN